MAWEAKELASEGHPSARLGQALRLPALRHAHDRRRGFAPLHTPFVISLLGIDSESGETYDFSRTGRRQFQLTARVSRPDTEAIAPMRQDLLYLQAKKSSITADVVGMRILEDGELSDGPEDPEDWPYKTVLDAIKDGWRVVKFPELALMLHEERFYGIGCEFILEKIR